MANKFQLKRTTISGRTPNTTNSANTSFIDAGELAINLVDGILYSSNGTVSFEVGANLSSLRVGSNVVINSTSLFIGNSSVNTFITSSTLSTANVNITGSFLLGGSPGTSFYVATSNGSTASWQPIPGTPIYDSTGTQIANLYATVANYINDLSDVDTITVAPANNNLLVWSNTSSNWIPSSNLDVQSVKINGSLAVNGPAFSAYPNSSITQTITSGSQQKVLFQLEEYDTNGNFASSRFTPTVAGYYQLNAVVRIAGTMGTGESMLIIWKNGAEYKRGWNASGTEVGASFFGMGVSTMAYANGAGDYFEVYIQQGSGGNRDVTVAGSNITWFNGAMVRGA